MFKKDNSRYFSFKRFFSCHPESIYLFLILLFSIVMSWPLFGENLLPGHDAESGFVKVVSMSRYWGDGQLFVRWIPDLVFGYGYVMFNFYQPLFSYLSAILSWIFHSPVMGLNIACFFVIFLSGVAMYVLVKDWFGRDAAFVSAVAYLFAPYHIVDMYVRAAYAELTAFVFFPLIFWALYRLYKTFQRRYFVLGVLSLSGLILAHQLMNFIFFPFIIGFIFFLCWQKKGQQVGRFLFLALLMVCLAYLSTAFFWVPAFLEKKFVNMDVILNGGFDYRLHFLYPYQLLKANWGYGYSSGGPHDGMDFHLGYTHMLLAIISLIFIIRFHKRHQQAFWLFMFSLIVMIIAVFFTLRISLPLWKKISFMSFIQFPWRYLAVVSFGISLLTGAWAIFKHPHKKYFLGLVIGLIFFTNIFYCHAPKSKTVDVQRGFDSGKYGLPLDHVEFISIWTKKVPSKYPKNKLEVWIGDAVIEKEKRVSSIKYSFDVSAKKDSILCFHVFYFPGWKVFVDGKEVAIDPNNESGLIVFKVPAGKHKIVIYFGLSSARLAGILISIGAVVFLVFFMFSRKMWRKQ